MYVLVVYLKSFYFILVNLSNILKLWFSRDFFDMIFQKNQLYGFSLFLVYL